MSEIYSDCHREIQNRYDARALADRTVEAIVHSEFTVQDIAFISERDFFFLSTVDPSGHPTVSYKGGAPGFVAVEDNTLVFPSFDGNGMFLSMGNIAHNPNVGLLFMDFERPRRLRVQGVASLDEQNTVPGAQFLVRVKPLQIFVNCPRYVHRYARIKTSKYVPADDGSAPLAQWKRLPVVQDVLSPADRAAATQLGLLSLEEYEAKVQAGDG
ncbi:pyridoxamine 5'-phosphate oxidase family protein [Hyphomicrobium sp.]|uniref:pyridoxamine 5'-phosphate oxidase family protein n=1 Tax=Hyphomicrobium sp. TaxID=82 RepID=UPI002E2EB1D7|nr:pyridoxamine 5'-phosphate oxidase family protein [Hyphomicrobium sp.]HEX2842686.1 pyridoxamine 5'-phosphate oxidase family protein [Hyphomicrobium sp.]